MFTFYYTEVFKHDWLIVFECDGEVTKIHNDKAALKRLLSTTQILIGYNNYNYGDKIIASIIKDKDPYETSQKIIKGERLRLNLNKPLTLDVSQELKGIELKEVQANMGLSIYEPPIDFNINRMLTNDEIELFFKYCENDVLTIKKLFEGRENYFTSKFEIVQDFKLPATSLKMTNANLAADVLKVRKNKYPDKTRLILTYDDRLMKQEIPKQIVDFYEHIQERFKDGSDYKELENEKFTYKLAGLEHIYGFGGLHAAKENYIDEGHFMQIDVKSYYPTLIINNSFLDCDALSIYKNIYNTRLDLKEQKDTSEQSYKLLINIVYGALKSPWNKLYNPQVANNIVVNGQLIMTHLIVLLGTMCDVVQTNTDGVIIKYNPQLEKQIITIIKWFADRYKIKFDIDYIEKIAQRDVNNYVVRYKNGKVKAKGRFANYGGGNFERNSLTIIDKALVEYYMNDVKINRTVINEWKKNNLELFQHVVKTGKFDGMAQELNESTLLEGTYNSRFIKLQKINRVFASTDPFRGAIFKTRNKAETQYMKVPYTSESCLVWNDDLSKLDKRRIDLNWYINEIQGWLF